MLHEVLHRFYGEHGQGDYTDQGNTDPPTTITGDDAANALFRQQLGFIQYKEYYPKL